MKDCIRYKERKWKYQLVDQYRVYLPELVALEAFDTFYMGLHHGVLTVKRLYAWDGPSGPTIDTNTFMRGSLVHDVLYQAIRLKLLPESYKDKADDILYMICRKDGMSWWRAWYVWKGVKCLGAGSCEPGSESKIMEAP